MTKDFTKRYSSCADDYAKNRPSYPASVIDAILEGLGEPSDILAADIGAGTGIGSHLLAERGVKVYAIEPNEAMIQAAKSHPLVEFYNNPAEKIALPAHLLDLVVCFQSFHWFNPIKSVLEFHRILKSSGKLAIVWSDFDKNDDFTSTYTSLVNQIANRELIKERFGDINPIIDSSLFVLSHQYEFSYCHQINFDGLIGYTKSSSIVSSEGEIYQEFLSSLKSLYSISKNTSGIVSLIFKAKVYIVLKK
ncbi:class I SAM-dependent methyltransferase [Spirulina sp. CCNP1310]|uniref:class I SAM-dependent methyltransferase n=1 Tax=Spirulina sp. CCNP1310 TaxID=3110249 RepID=UPI002B1F549C|nr:class I SAM-dependent methyltransferase [Spirulina sp. CCNP1310]MEA5419830.1 class I SAM-dependent methyltransferase [Spirulina sp. CCNP1310]